MFNHVMVGSNDIERSKSFYDAVLAVLGAGEPVRNQALSGHTRLFYRLHVPFCRAVCITREVRT